MTVPDPAALSVLWSDPALLVVNKPPGLATLPEGWDPAAPHVKAVLEPAYGSLWIVHRLDKETSGVLALARSAEAHRSLNGQFAGRQVEKVYHGLATGSPPWEEITTRLPLRANAGRRHRTVVDPRRGKPAVTHFKILERFQCRSATGRRRPAAPNLKETGQDCYFLVEARPETGRTHQIRAHLAALGFPLAGDLLYGSQALSSKRDSLRGASREAPLLNRAGLHARSLSLNHPVSGERITFEAPEPEDLAAALRQFRKHCRPG